MKAIYRSYRATLTIMVALMALSQPTGASTIDCQNVYVGRIWIEKGHGLYGAVFLNHYNDSGGSYWVWFFDWTAEEKKSALATLTTAKVMNHRVHVSTTEADACSIQTGQRLAKSVTLANQP
jgi:hypothetical protein